LDGEIFRLTPGEGAGDGADLIRGGAGADRVHGGAGDDTIRGDEGDDRLRGNGQDDVLAGGLGADRLWGGAGADVFDFNATAESGATGGSRDIIHDFAPGADLIDLATIDAREGEAGAQAFSFIGTADFSAEGQVRLVQTAAGVLVQVNTAGTGDEEMSILLRGLQVEDIGSADFLL
jgi:Ca2+-binding RTX toxin-like protein